MELFCCCFVFDGLGVGGWGLFWGCFFLMFVVLFCFCCGVFFFNVALIKFGSL